MKRINPTWTYDLHGNELLDRYGEDIYVKFMLSKGEKWAYVSDRLRVLVLRDEGGVYIDADAEPVKPFDSVPFWDMDHVDFAYGGRSTGRKQVALARGVSFIDNTFMGSRPNGRMITILDNLWSPATVTGEGNVVNGGLCGRTIFDHQNWTCAPLGFKYIYSETLFPETIVLHDAHNLGSWRPEYKPA